VRTESFGEHCTLIFGDVLEVLPGLARGSNAALITDPPYSSGGAFRGDRMAQTSAKYVSSDTQIDYPEFTGDNRDQRGFTYWSTLWLMHALDAAAPGAVAALFSDWRQLPAMTDALQAAGWMWRGIVPWDKVVARPMPNRFKQQCEFLVWGTNGPRPTEQEGAAYHPGILREQPPVGAEREHITQKPVGILQHLVRVAPIGGVVLDPFMGSGSTGLACALEGRGFIGVEKDLRIFDRTCARLDAAFRQAPMFQPADEPLGTIPQELLL
jgi:site-specific DNA-methyltransferase (adenine-specific)